MPFGFSYISLFEFQHDGMKFQVHRNAPGVNEGLFLVMIINVGLTNFSMN